MVDLVRPTLENTFETNIGSTSFTVRGASGSFQPNYIFAKNYNELPKQIASVSINGCNGLATQAKIITFLETELGMSFDTMSIGNCYVDLVKSRPEDIETPKFSRSNLLVARNAKFVAEIELSILATSMTITVFADSREYYDRLMVFFAEEIKNMPLATQPPVANKFYMVAQNSNGLQLMEYDISQEKMSDFDIDLMYNDDFKPVAEHIKTTLSKKGSGIVLLHGIYGSGKTTYLRHLISSAKKRVIYLPPDMAAQLTEPSFFNFIKGYPDSVLVIEDAENILRKRIGGASSATSNILNMSDGIIGDALKIQIVCTFNADIDEIDEALLRPGRLIANHYFDVLKKDKTKRLVEHVYGEGKEPPKEEMTLAEIYNMESDVMDNTASTRSKSFVFGFKPN